MLSFTFRQVLKMFCQTEEETMCKHWVGCCNLTGYFACKGLEEDCIKTFDASATYEKMKAMLNEVTKAVTI